MRLSTHGNVWEMSRLQHERVPAGSALPGARGPLWVLVLDGSAELETAAERHALDPGDAALVAARTAHRLVAGENLLVAAADLRPVVASSYRLPSPFVVRGFSGRHPAVTRLIGTCPLEGRCLTPLFAFGYASLLGAALVTSWLETRERDERPGQDEAVADVLAALASDPGEDWTPERMARVAHLSRSALTARFRRATGRSPMEILRELRMHHARTLLADGSQPVGRVASAVGYGSVAAFSRAFAAHHGAAPQAWRAATSSSAAGHPQEPEAEAGGERRGGPDDQRHPHAVRV
ncbi:helix-turn-helix domain-containing protein [Frankia sp. AgB1.9]|uniref:helix-turn-helix transcriptional regulator n=1 Tax=unclassified Frankia TaxID=2632575 RepID=UPI001933B94D|nr:MULTISPECIES: AraC family transcriptional regulator [unclassified Frankia]MBL7488924.1 helix-turn-helix domain-containing protein [Frankia sp. AgW1.1]MBL7546729.1 helix-turn-helix domain-containing protein [Frankia sp. AgB1.9]MBL7621823.1 helix-turn-helix domain-containing protein [Frankia sp. AgB1.8]